MKAQCDANEGPAKEGVTSASFAFTDGFSMFVTFVFSKLCNGDC
jgi:hypothetical protein